MGTKNIRGITIEVSADAKKFTKSMNEVRKDARSSQKELNALQKSLELKFDSATFARAQKVAQDAIDHTAEQADVLRKRLEHLENAGKMDTAEYRKIQAELAEAELKGKQLQEQLEAINRIKFEKIADSVENVGNKIKGAGQALTPFSVASAGILTGMGALGAKAVSSADEIATLATQYDMTAEALQRFNYIALQTDTDADVLYKAFVKMRAGAADLATGVTSIPSSALKKLGIDLNSIGSSEDQFYAIISALADMEDQTQMVAIANDIFGEKLANNLLPMIYSGSDAIAAYSKEFESMGALSDEQITALAEFDNVLNGLNTQFANVGLQVGESLLPIMQRLAEFTSTEIIPKLQELTEWFSGLSPEMQENILKILGIIAIAAPLLTVFGNMTTGLSNLIRFFGNLNAAQLLTIAGFAAMIGAGMLVFDMISNWESMTWVEKLLKSLALAALVAAAAIGVFHASWSLGLAIGAIAAGVTAAIAAINAAKKEVLPEEEDFTADNLNSIDGAPSTTDSPAIDLSKYENPEAYLNGDPEAYLNGTVYDQIGAGGTTGDIYHTDNSTNTTEQNVTVIIQNYSEEVDVDDLVHQINVKLAEAM